MKRTMALKSAAVLGVASLALAACGGSSTSSESSAAPAASEAAPAASEAAPAASEAAPASGPCKIGTMLPQTGNLAFLGPPEFAGVDLAVKDINDAGGYNGKPVKQVKADSGDGTPNIAPSETDKLLRGGADAIVGAASSSVSLSVIDRITNAGVLQISPANTSTAFDTYADKGLYFRTAPSDVLQGQVLASTAIDDGHQNIAIMARQEAYGEALAKNVRKFFEQAGGKVVAYKLYDPNAANFTAEVNAIKGEDPDAVVLVAFDETKKIIPELVKAGLGQKH